MIEVDSRLRAMLLKMHLQCLTRGRHREPGQEHTVESVECSPPRRKSHAISPILARTPGRVHSRNGFILEQLHHSAPC